MSGPAELAIAAGVLLDAGLKVTVVLGVGWGAARLLPGGSAAQRHAVWATTLALLPVLPLFSAQRGPEVAIDAPWIVALWLTGVAVSVFPIARGLLQLRRLVAEATADAECGDVLHTEALPGPVTFGLLRPVILLPTAAALWPATHRHAALAHERAHIQRRDWAVHLGAWAVCALFWFHPLVWLARRELAREAEHAADDAVLEGGVLASDYASLLLALARREPPRAALGASSSLVGRRVRALLDGRSRSSRRWPAWVLAAVLAFVTLPALASWPTWTAPEATLTCAPGPHS